MPSAFGHGLVGLTLARSGSTDRLLLFLLPLCTLVPDLDVIAFRLHIPYESPLGHRGVTHSLLFAGLLSVLGALATGPRERGRHFLLFFLATASHGLLDAMTTGGLGVGFFIPFSNGRYFLPWRPIRVSPLGAGRFLDQAWTIVGSEALWIGVPCALVLMASRLRRLQRS
jgi:inner membrane protein